MFKGLLEGFKCINLFSYVLLAMRYRRVIKSYLMKLATLCFSLIFPAYGCMTQ